MRLNSTATDSLCLKLCSEKHRIMRHYRTELQTTMQTLITTQYSIEFTYSDFPYHLKENRDNLALINRQWKCKKGKGNDYCRFAHEIDQHDSDKNAGNS